MNLQEAVAETQATIDQFKQQPATEHRDYMITVGETLLQLANEVKELKETMAAQQDFIDTALR